MARVQDKNRLVFGSKTLTWVELQALAEAALGSPERFAENRFVAVVDSMESALAALVYGVAHRLDWGVIETTRVSPEVEDRFYSSGVALVDFSTGSKRVAVSTLTGFVPGRITVLTSGTTGLLKLIPHTDKTLNTFDRVQELRPNRWFLPYQIGSYAWYQMAMLGLFVAGQDLIPGDFSDLAGSFATALQSHQITAISSTPTFWRHALMMTQENLLATAPLQSISLGGEIVDQAILDRLASLYPAAAIRHIYASSEAGAAIIVSDGCAGFPKSLLQQENGAVAIKVDDGRLFIRSRYGNSGAGGGWIDTGDLVEIRNDRVQFCGRADNSMINVGGQKAFPADIEAHLLTHPDVVWVKVSARRAPLVGFLPVATVVLREPHDPIAAETILTRHCESRLAEYAVPRIWSFLETVPMQASLKS